MFATVVYSATMLFYSKSENSNFSKKTIFTFGLNSGLSQMNVGPKDTICVNPYIENTSTEEMYVFIKIDMPKYLDDFIYSFIANENWLLVEGNDESIVFAYGSSDELCNVKPGEETEPLTEQMQFINITNAEFYGMEDINLKISGYAIGMDVVFDSVNSAWETCKAMIDN